MKIGLSFSRCVRDIFEGKVDREDVLVIVARTNFDPLDDKQWENIWNGYTNLSGVSHPEWMQYPECEAEFRGICIDLYEHGKLHQPRKFGAHPPRLPYYWLDTFAPEAEIANNPAVQKAWDKYKLLAGLS